MMISDDDQDLYFDLISDLSLHSFSFILISFTFWFASIVI